MAIGSDLLTLLPQLLALLTAVAALVAEMLRRPRWALWLTLAGLLGGAGLAATRLGQDTTVFMGTYRVDALSTWAVVVLLPATALAAVLVEPEVRGTDREGTVYSLLSFTLTGALVLAGAGDAMLLVLGLLLSSLGAFALTAYPRNDRATEAAVKYFVFGSVAEAVLVFGVSYWFGASGTTELNGLARLDTGARLAALAGLVGVLTGLGYKAALVPFHFWAPDVYDGAPLGVAAFISVVPKVGAIFGLTQVVAALPDDVVAWRLLLAIVAVASMTYGNLAALAQTNVVRLLAYSSIAQSGYFVLGVVAFGRSGMAMPSLAVFAAAYAAMNLGVFALVAQVGRELNAFIGLAGRAPRRVVALVLFLLSLVGVPPLAGFFGKLLLFGAAVDAGFTWLAVAAILNSVLSLGVYLRLIAPAFRRPSGAPGGPASTFAARDADHPTGGWASTAVFAVSLAATVVFGIAVQLLLARPA